MPKFEINNTSYTDRQLQEARRNIFPDDRSFHQFVGKFFCQIQHELKDSLAGNHSSTLVDCMAQTGLMVDTNQIKERVDVNGIRVSAMNGSVYDRLLFQYRYAYAGNEPDFSEELPYYGIVNSWKHIDPREEVNKVTVGVSVFFDPKKGSLSKIVYYGYEDNTEDPTDNQTIILHFVKVDEPLESQILIDRGTGNLKMVSQNDQELVYQYQYTEGEPEDIGRTFRQRLIPFGFYTDESGTNFLRYLEKDGAEEILAA